MLYGKGGKTPKVEIQKPEKVIGKNTIDSMQSGLVYGYVGQVDYIVNRIKRDEGTGYKSHRNRRLSKGDCS